MVGRANHISGLCLIWAQPIWRPAFIISFQYPKKPESTDFDSKRLSVHEILQRIGLWEHWRKIGPRIQITKQCNRSNECWWLLKDFMNPPLRIANPAGSRSYTPSRAHQTYVTLCLCALRISIVCTAYLDIDLNSLIRGAGQSWNEVAEQVSLL